MAKQNQIKNNSNLNYPDVIARYQFDKNYNELDEKQKNRIVSDLKEMEEIV